MTINKAPLPIQFAGGVDTRTDSKQVVTAKLLDLQNAVFTKQATISKRNGYRALSTQIQANGGNIANARGLGERDGEVLLFTDKHCYSYRPSADLWSDSGEVAATIATTPPIARTGTAQTQPDVADRHGVRVIAWEDSRGGVWCSVIEIETGRILQGQIQLDAAVLARSPRCLPVDDVLHVLWTREDLGSIQIAVINPATPTASPLAATLTSDLGSPPTYDAESARLAAGFVPVGGGKPGIVAWNQAGGGWRVGYIHGSGVLGSPLTGLPGVVTYPDAVTGPMAITADWVIQGWVTVAWISGAAIVMARIVNGVDLSPIQSYAQLGAGAAAYSRLTICTGKTPGIESTDQEMTLYWAAEIPGARTDLCAIESGSVVFASSPTAAMTSTVLRGHGLVSRAWYIDPDLSPAIDEVTGLYTLVGDVYVGISHTVRFFPYVAALRLSGNAGIASPNNIIVARLLPGECTGSLMRSTGPGASAWTTHLPSSLDVDQQDDEFWTRQHAIPLPYRIQLSSQNGDQFSEQGIKLATIDYDAPYQTAQLGRGLYLASAAPMHYDGDAWHEADFHCAPDYGYDTAGTPVDMTTAIAPVAGGSIANGTYLYAFAYEVVDAQGELHRGPVSVKMLVTMAGGPRSFSMAIPTCRLTRFGRVRIGVFRSEQGATGTDDTIELFRVTSTDVTVSTGSNRYVLNDPTVDTVTFVDGLADSALKTREPLYTNGGILSNAPSPWGGGILAVGKSRLYWTDSTDPNILRYSQQIADDTALEAPVDLSLRKDPFGGDLTAIGVMDDTVIPFSETAVYVFSGPGPLADPDAAPEANAFTPVELVTTDVGCISAASVGQTPSGLTFKSAKGIMLLTRDRQIVNIGNDVQKYDGQNVVRSTLIPSAQRIVYLTDSGRTLMWDYNRNAWSTFTNHEGLDAVVVDNLYYYLRTDSRVFVETPGAYRDDNTRIPMLIETAWIHFAQYLQGWQRIIYAYFLGRFISAHTLSVRYRLNYDEAYSPAILNDVNANWNPSEFGAGPYGVGAYGGSGGSGTRYQRRIHLNRRCQAISFRIEDIEATDDFGASFELSELLLIGGGIGADFKPGAARSA